ncbi:MAG: CRISPR system Cascade subunit CasC [Lentisphaerae bacterium ADurb.Bin242]|nr:MAG: CRISPR system Cascade subunit CasC [Lentisphaerae bacterium ADurb.Bin242]
MSSKFTNTRIEFHIIQSFPVSCLNRDDVGAPKSALIGGIERARVSSQCWKRAVRLAMHDLGIAIGSRTKYISQCVADHCAALGASAEQAKTCGEAAAKAFAKSVKEDGQSDTLFFISESEAGGLANFFQKTGFDPKADVKQLQKACKDAINPAHDGLDIALFGRMVANAQEMNIEAAASFAHAISTHKAIPEVDFFTAVDDCNKNDSGAGHMGSLEFNSATYYRYVSLDLGQLEANKIASADIFPAVEAFTKALFIAVPQARQATMTAATPWDYALVTLRKGQRVQIPFNEAVRPQNGTGLAAASIAQLKDRFQAMEKFYGSLFGCKAKWEAAPGLGGIDELLSSMRSALDTL